MKKVLVAKTLIVLAVMLASCEKPVEGNLRIIFDPLDYKACFADWSTGGDEIFFILDDETFPLDSTYLYSLRLSDGVTRQVSDRSIEGFNVSNTADVVATNDNGYLWIWDTDTWTKVDSLSSNYLMVFSYVTDRILYYIEVIDLFSGKGSLHRVNLDGHTDSVVYSIENGFFPFSPGPGDSLFVIGNRIVNINSGEETEIETKKKVNHVDWYPWDADRLVVCADYYKELLIYSVDSRELIPLDLKPEIGSQCQVSYPRVSPVGEKIIFNVDTPRDPFLETKLWLWSFGY